ncbi:hypothetical protein IWQ60_011528 [Tieghemiomyces parasiticus]|uniref:Uncharacterized protein n=1 Tax=Tieghemiomyces parasiticus TaxID=78921 RepID=A0A9W7ZNT2_9FUNG|nr:hypothetical protein IWQ60_011528 [Tieghemiomyces parasiticus]
MKLTVASILALAIIHSTAASQRIQLPPCPDYPLPPLVRFACIPDPIVALPIPLTTTSSPTSKPTSHCTGDPDKFESYTVTLDVSTGSITRAKLSFKQALKRSGLCYNAMGVDIRTPDAIRVSIDPQYEGQLRSLSRVLSVEAGN